MNPGENPDLVHKFLAVSSNLFPSSQNKDFDLVRKVLDDVVKCRVLLMVSGHL